MDVVIKDRYKKPGQITLIKEPRAFTTGTRSQLIQKDFTPSARSVAAD